MRFEQNFSQKQTQVQKLAMTQQLQQSIQMLQFNADDLRSFLENKALENPLMELKVEQDNTELPYGNRTQSQNFEGNEANYMEQIPDAGISLFEFLLEQIHLNYRDTYLRQLVLFLTEYIDVNGFLNTTLEEAVSKTGAEPIQMLDALVLLQQLDPAGVGARNLQECLMLQTERDENAPALTYIILEECFEDLVGRKWQNIAKKYAIELSEVQRVFDYIQTLSPRPGAKYGEIPQAYIVPDLIVEETADGLGIRRTKRSAPVLEFQQTYFEKMQQQGDQEVQNYLKERKAEFDWLKRSVLQRGDTILKIGLEILRRQRAFFTEKGHPLTPMTLKEVADALEIHESTVSRGVNGKYLQTPFGTFELRSFFTTGISVKLNPGETENETVSSASVKKKLKELVDGEDKKKPLADQKLAELLAAEGFAISRRTVAKYRDLLGILTSSKRKRFE